MNNEYNILNSHTNVYSVCVHFVLELEKLDLNN